MLEQQKMAMGSPNINGSSIISPMQNTPIIAPYGQTPFGQSYEQSQYGQPQYGQPQYGQPQYV